MRRFDPYRDSLRDRHPSLSQRYRNESQYPRRPSVDRPFDYEEGDHYGRSSRFPNAEQPHLRDPQIQRANLGREDSSHYPQDHVQSHTEGELGRYPKSLRRDLDYVRHIPLPSLDRSLGNNVRDTGSARDREGSYGRSRPSFREQRDFEQPRAPFPPRDSVTAVTILQLRDPREPRPFLKRRPSMLESRSRDPGTGHPEREGRYGDYHPFFSDLRIRPAPTSGGSYDRDRMDSTDELRDWSRKTHQEEATWDREMRNRPHNREEEDLTGSRGGPHDYHSASRPTAMPVGAHRPRPDIRSHEPNPSMRAREQNAAPYDALGVSWRRDASLADPGNISYKRNLSNRRHGRQDEARPRPSMLRKRSVSPVQPLKTPERRSGRAGTPLESPVSAHGSFTYFSRDISHISPKLKSELMDEGVDQNNSATVDAESHPNPDEDKASSDGEKSASSNEGSLSLERLADLEDEIAEYSELLDIVKQRENPIDGGSALSPSAANSMGGGDGMVVGADSTADAEDDSGTSEGMDGNGSLLDIECEDIMDVESSLDENIIDSEITGLIESSVVEEKKPDSLPLWERIIRENRRKASEYHTALANQMEGKIQCEPIKVLFANPSDYAFFEQNVETHHSMRAAIVQHVANRKAEVANKCAALRLEYKQRLEQWRRSVDLMQQEEAKKRRKHGKPGAPLFGSASTSALFTSSGSGSNAGSYARAPRRATFNSDAVKTEAEFQYALALLGNADEDPTDHDPDRSAVEPPMVIDPLQRKLLKFQNFNDFVYNPASDLTRFNARLGMTWSEVEQLIFKEKFLLYGKDFHAVAKHLPHKTTRDCVEYYYREKNRLNLKSALKKAMRQQRAKKKAAEARKAEKEVVPGPGRSYLIHPTESTTTGAASGPGRRGRPKEGTAGRVAKVINETRAEVRRRNSRGRVREQVEGGDAEDQLDDETDSTRKKGHTTTANGGELTEEIAGEMEVATNVEKDFAKNTMDTVNSPKLVASPQDGGIAPNGEALLEDDFAPEKRRIPKDAEEDIGDEDNSMQEGTDSLRSSPHQRRTTVSYWDVEAKAAFRDAYLEHGQNWELVAAHVENKSAKQVENYYKKNQEAIDRLKDGAASSRDGMDVEFGQAAYEITQQDPLAALEELSPPLHRAIVEDQLENDEPPAVRAPKTNVLRNLGGRGKEIPQHEKWDQDRMGQSATRYAPAPERLLDAAMAPFPTHIPYALLHHPTLSRDQHPQPQQAAAAMAAQRVAKSAQYSIHPYVERLQRAQRQHSTVHATFSKPRSGSISAHYSQVGHLGNIGAIAITRFGTDTSSRPHLVPPQPMSRPADKYQ